MVSAAGVILSSRPSSHPNSNGRIPLDKLIISSRYFYITNSSYPLIDKNINPITSDYYIYYKIYYTKRTLCATLVSRYLVI